MSTNPTPESKNATNGYNILLDCLCYVVQETAPDVNNAKEIATLIYNTYDHSELLQLLQYRAFPASIRHFDHERSRGVQTLNDNIARARNLLVDYHDSKLPEASSTAGQ